MKKNLRSVKTTLILGILIISIFAAMAPPAAAESAIGLQSLVSIDPQSIGDIVPRSGSQVYTLKLTYEVTRGAIFAKVLFPLYIGRQVNIHLAIVDQPSWCHANILDATLTTTIKFENKTELDGKISIAIDANAPAYGGGYVTIKTTVDKIGLIAGFEKQITIPFNPSYLPMIKAEPEGGTNSKTIGPMDTIVFPIKVENMGNARTEVFIKVENVSADWVAIIDDSIWIDESAGSTGTAYLTIRPPKGFGYHDDIKTITVSLEPARAENPNQRGSPVFVTVSVESRGFSFIGAEIVLPIIIIIIVLLFAIYWFVKRMRK